jgi:hypothetical protein
MLPVGSALFADETKAKSYSFAVVAIQPEHLAESRRALSAMRIAGQRALHFKNENERRRKEIMKLIHKQGWQAVIVSSNEPNQRYARKACLHAVLEISKECRAPTTVFERDASVAKFDNQVLYRKTRQLDFAENFTYSLLPRQSEPCLWVADAVAWSFARGGSWRKRLSGVLVGVHPC